MGCNCKKNKGIKTQGQPCTGPNCGPKVTGAKVQGKTTK